MKIWRPTGWPECKCDKCTTKQMDLFGYLCDLSCGEYSAYTNFEAGADLMVKLLREQQAFKVNDKCKDVCIPNDKDEQNAVV